MEGGIELRVQVGRRDPMFPALGNMHSKNAWMGWGGRTLLKPIDQTQLPMGHSCAHGHWPVLLPGPRLQLCPSGATKPAELMSSNEIRARVAGRVLLSVAR